MQYIIGPLRIGRSPDLTHPHVHPPVSMSVSRTQQHVLQHPTQSTIRLLYKRLYVDNTMATGFVLRIYFCYILYFSLRWYLQLFLFHFIIFVAMASKNHPTPNGKVVFELKTLTLITIVKCYQQIMFIYYKHQTTLGDIIFPLWRIKSSF